MKRLLAALAFLIALPVQAQIAFDNVTTQPISTANNIQANHLVTGSNVIVIATVFLPTVTSDLNVTCDLDTVLMTQRRSQIGSNGGTLEQWYTLNVPPGTVQIDCSWGASRSGLLQVASYTNVSGVTIGEGTDVLPSSTVLDRTIDPTTPGNVMFSNIRVESSGLAADAAYSERSIVSNAGHDYGLADRDVVAATTQYRWTWSTSSRQNFTTFELEPTAGAAPPNASVDGPWPNAVTNVPEPVVCSRASGDPETSVLWTHDAGGAGSFADPNVLSTTFTRTSAGTANLTCTLTNSGGSGTPDSALLTASDPPSNSIPAILITGGDL